MKKRQRNQVNDSQKSNHVHIEGRTQRQRDYIHAINCYSQVFAVGPAGTGKTYIPTVIATKMYLRREVSKIIITRPAVGASGEQHGFLPGDLRSKLAPWALPIIEVIEAIVGRASLDDMLKSGDIEVAPFTYMRGRTFSNAFVILDEAQNCTAEQMELFLTRTGEDAKVIICGDTKQTDLKSRNGLQLAISLLNNNNIPAKLISFTSEDVVRSDLCRAWVEAFATVIPPSADQQYHPRTLHL